MNPIVAPRVQTRRHRLVGSLSPFHIVEPAQPPLPIRLHHPRNLLQCRQLEQIVVVERDEVRGHLLPLEDVLEADVTTLRETFEAEVMQEDYSRVRFGDLLEDGERVRVVRVVVHDDPEEGLQRLPKERGGGFEESSPTRVVGRGDDRDDGVLG